MQKILKEKKYIQKFKILSWHHIYGRHQIFPGSILLPESLLSFSSLPKSMNHSFRRQVATALSKYLIRFRSALMLQSRIKNYMHKLLSPTTTAPNTVKLYWKFWQNCFFLDLFPRSIQRERHIFTDAKSILEVLVVLWLQGYTMLTRFYEKHFERKKIHPKI